MSLNDLDILDSGEECPDEYEGLNEPIPTNRGNGQNRTAVYEPANIFICNRYAESLRQEKVEAVISHLAKTFQAKRLEIMERAYKGGKAYGIYGNDRERFFNNDNDRRSAFPNTRYFEEEMLPTLELMAKGDPDALYEIGNDAIQCLGYLTYFGFRASVFRGLVHSFFEPCYEKDLDEKGKLHTHSHDGSEKTFQYLYEKYGKLVAIIAAKFQGTICDEHYDGMDYSWGMWQLEGMLGGFWNELPPEYRNDALEVVSACEYHTRIEEVCAKLPDVVKKIQEAGKGHMLPIYFKLARSAAISVGDSLRDEAFPVLDAERAIKELTAIEDMTIFQKEGVDFAELVLRTSRDKYSPNRPTFIKKKKGTNDYDYLHVGGFGVNVAEAIDKLSDLQKRKGLPDEKINAILHIPEQVPSVGYRIVDQYELLDDNFPGGVDGLLEYIRFFQGAPNCARRLVDDCAGKMLPKENVGVFLEMGALAVTSIGDSASAYFDAGRMEPPMLQVLKKSPAKFKILVRHAIGFAEKFGKTASNKAFDAYAKYCLEPGFRGYRDGMMLVLKRAKAMGCKEDVLREAMETYEHVPYRFSKEGRGLYKLPGGVNMKDHARIINALVLSDESARFSGAYDAFADLVGKGVDYRVAAMVKITYQRNNRGESRQALFDTREIPGLECPVPVGKLNNLARKITGIRAAIAKVYDCVDDQRAHWAKERIVKLSRREAIAQMPQLSLAEMDKQLKVIASIESDAELAGFVDLKGLKAEVESVRSLAFFRQLIGSSLTGGFNVSSGRVDIPKEGLMATGEESTRALIAMVSTLTAIGAMEVEGCDPRRFERLPVSGAGLFLPGNQGTGKDLSIVLRKYEGALIRNIGNAIPLVERRVLQAREETLGQMAGGGKIHTHHPMSKDLLAFLEKVFGLTNTSFQLIHAGQSLLLPVTMSGAELRLMVRVLKTLGVTGAEPDLQFCGAGEQSEEVAAIMGASILLGATRAVPYANGAFSTTHDKGTGARIMALGAGVRRTGLPFDVPEAHNRLDILAQHDPFGFDRFRVLTTLANHAKHGKRFGYLMKVYVEKFNRILYEHNLLPFLHESAWVFDHAQKGDSLEAHERMVGRFMGEWTRSSNSVDFGVIREVNQLLVEMEQAIKAEKEALIRENPDDYQMLLRM
ncbi:MAG: hypothetical protein US89_C0003G0013 [Candidatus Peregrinibacteria bacterium GW2011_GWF2_38_29]|nr:MAG: hypothetical protein US89_C0003G0013 [Candidatus Peregrinibacteria bacterium GW2011_GWF2_38_29]HBB02895.1 hypothetical protein [Candidatus Peregrinibacteria bacterium]